LKASAQLNGGGSPKIGDLIVDGIERHRLRCHVFFPHQVIKQSVIKHWRTGSGLKRQSLQKIALDAV
jgi:hypothetical protein